MEFGSGRGDAAQTDFAAVGGGQHDVGAMQTKHGGKSGRILAQRVRGDGYFSGLS